MTTPFWSNDIFILFNKKQIMQLYPTPDMTYEEKMNAISRIIILLTILGYLLSKNINIIIVGIITLGIIYSLYKYQKQNNINTLLQKEGFLNNYKNDIEKNPLEKILQKDFHPTTKKNPFGNVLLTDIMDEPNRNAAAPSFNPDVHENINKAVKKQTQMLNPSIKNTNKQIYGDLKDNYDLDKSMMRFYSTANSRVCNDQGAYAEFLYGNMPSGKSSGPDGAFARVQDNLRYILL